MPAERGTGTVLDAFPKMGAIAFGSIVGIVQMCSNEVMVL